MDRNTKFFKDTIARDLRTKFPYRGGHELCLKSISLHLSLRESSFDAETFLYPKMFALELLVGQKGNYHFSRKSISHLHIQKGFLAGISVRMRSKLMYNFLEDLRTTVLPNINGFDGVSLSSLDTHGNFNFRLENLVRFRTIEEEYLKFQLGDIKAASSGRYFPLDIQFQTSARNLSEGALLLSAFQIPVN